MKINVPNALTFFRVVLVPCFVGIYYLPHTLINQSLMNWIGAGIFLFAAITDWLDGFFFASLYKINTATNSGYVCDTSIRISSILTGFCYLHGFRS